MTDILEKAENPVKAIWQRFKTHDITASELKIEIAFWVCEHLEDYDYLVEPVKSVPLRQYQEMTELDKKGLTKERIEYLLNEKKNWEGAKRARMSENWGRFVNLVNYKNILIKNGSPEFAQKIHQALHEHKRNGVENYFNN